MSEHTPRLTLTPHDAAPVRSTRIATQPGLLQRLPWLREPLLHFLLLGAVLFAVDHVLSGAAENPRLIVISPAVDQEARQLFKASRGREPNAEERAALHRTWLDNEVLYREGLALQVDRGDVAIRERVIFKALSMVDASVEGGGGNEQTLRDWFERHRSKYDEPARFDFQEAVLVGDSNEAAVRAFVEQLNKGAGGDLNAGLRVFKGRPLASVEQSYGAAFARSLESGAHPAAPISDKPGGDLRDWRALQTSQGWRAIRLESATPAQAAQFDVLRNVVQQDWTDFVMAEQRTQAVRALGLKYTVLNPVLRP